MKAIYVLLLLAVATPLFALIPTEDQDPQAKDWSADVEKAATSRRYAIRRAAANKIAAAGAPAVDAIAAYAKKNGRNALPLTLISAIANQKTTAAEVVDQLLGWARDREFYWRPEAFRGLALRAPALPSRRDELVELFTSHRDDAAWMVATNARLGLHLLDTGDRTASPDDDPRLAAKLAGLLLDRGLSADLQPLVDALADERTFLGDPWGQRMAGDAHKALKRALGEATPPANENKLAAIEAMRAAIRTRMGQELRQPELLVDGAAEIVGGVEVLSCRNGDLFVQWTADGRIFEGIDSRFCVHLGDETWTELSNARATLPLESNLGVVICDKMRLKWDDPELHIQIAPESLPPAAAEWFRRLANALQKADKNRLASAVLTMVEQFASR